MESIFIVKELSTGKYLSMDRDKGLYLDIDVNDAKIYYTKDQVKESLIQINEEHCWKSIEPKNCYIFQIIKVYQVVIK
jgi:hypothetical protein